jgi:DNA-binding response OmpR family regulator
MLAINETTWIAPIKGATLDLTRREFQILRVMFTRPRRVFSPAQLLNVALPDNTSVIDRTIDSHIKNIHAKLRPVSPDWNPIRLRRRICIRGVSSSD